VTASKRSRPEPRLDRERWRLLLRLQRWLETPMLVLGFIWLVLLVLELVRGISTELETLGTAIWIIFIAEFALSLTLAPRKFKFLRSNWLSAVSLIVPALRVFRIFRVIRVLRAARATRGLRLVRVIGSLNRGMQALGQSMGRRGFGYALLLTTLVIFVGAAGMFAFEQALPNGDGLRDYWDALWWTGMLMTTIGSEYWPATAEGRTLAFLLSVYAVAVFGYVTAALATFFIGRDAEARGGEIAGAAAIDRLQEEIAGLRDELRGLAAGNRSSPTER
jgi:voltage-gated potassium channel